MCTTAPDYHPLIYDINLQSIELSNLFNQNDKKNSRNTPMSQCSITFKSLASIPIPCLTDILLLLTTLLFANLFINLTK